MTSRSRIARTRQYCFTCASCMFAVVKYAAITLFGILYVGWLLVCLAIGVQGLVRGDFIAGALSVLCLWVVVSLAVYSIGAVLEIWERP